MTTKEKLIQKIRNNPANVRFEELCKVIEMFGFVRNGGVGSHRFYGYKGIAGALNVQPKNGMAKPYQVRQFLKIVEDYNLKVV